VRLKVEGHLETILFAERRVRIRPFQRTKWASDQDVVDAERGGASRKLSHQPSGYSGQWMRRHRLHPHEKCQHGAHPLQVFLDADAELLFAFHAHFQKKSAGEGDHDVEVMRYADQVVAEDVIFKNHLENGRGSLVC